MSESDQNKTLDELIASYLQAVERGEEPDQAQWLADHPAQADGLQAFFADDSQINRQVAAADQPTRDKQTAQQPYLGSTVDSQGLPTGSSPRIGNYKLLQQLGSGGMGEVWMAEQEKPVKRRVAIKLIKAGMDSKAVLARFDAERQALALMNHPNIAKVFDAGIIGAEDQSMGVGRPFFAMELVRGIPITEYCDSRRLEIRERLKLFRQCCSAVHHAHQKGIIHRDLKPSNVLVESHDDEPVLKVIDFGLAKAIGGTQLTEQTLFTAMGTVAGTPLYMAPEQAVLNALDIDIRADVFSLGVLLYELMTGTTPLTSETFKEKGLDELLKLIREYEPPSPSQRVSSSETLASIAALRQIEPKRLGRFVRGELDWISMKALAKERERRYGSALALSDDIDRYLNEEPVQASPPSKLYQLNKFARKHRGLAGGAAAFAAALSIGILGTSWGFYSASEAARDAIQAKEEALRERNAKDRALTEEASARKIAEVQRAIAESHLAEKIVRPISNGVRGQTNVVEKLSLAEWATLQDTLKLRIFERAVSDERTAARLAFRASEVMQACVGTSRRRLEAIRSTLLRIEQSDNLPQTHIFAIRRLLAEVGSISGAGLGCCLEQVVASDSELELRLLQSFVGMEITKSTVRSLNSAGVARTLELLRELQRKRNREHDEILVSLFEYIIPTLSDDQRKKLLQEQIGALYSGRSMLAQSVLSLLLSSESAVAKQVDYESILMHYAAEEHILTRRVKKFLFSLASHVDSNTASGLASGLLATIQGGHDYSKLKGCKEVFCAVASKLPPDVAQAYAQELMVIAFRETPSFQGDCACEILSRLVEKLPPELAQSLCEKSIENLPNFRQVDIGQSIREQDAILSLLVAAAKHVDETTFSEVVAVLIADQQSIPTFYSFATREHWIDLSPKLSSDDAERVWQLAFVEASYGGMGADHKFDELISALLPRIAKPGKSALWDMHFATFSKEDSDIYGEAKLLQAIAENSQGEQLLEQVEALNSSLVGDRSVEYRDAVYEILSNLAHRFDGKLAENAVLQLNEELDVSDVFLIAPSAFDYLKSVAPMLNRQQCDSALQASVRVFQRADAQELPSSAPEAIAMLASRLGQNRKAAAFDSIIQFLEQTDSATSRTTAFASLVKLLQKWDSRSRSETAESLVRKICHLQLSDRDFEATTNLISVASSLQNKGDEFIAQNFWQVQTNWETARTDRHNECRTTKLLQAVNDPNAIVRLLQHPEAVGEVRSAILRRLEEVLLRGGEPLWSSVESVILDKDDFAERGEEEKASWLLRLDELPNRQLNEIHDAIEWLAENRPDLDLDAPYLPEDYQLTP